MYNPTTEEHVADVSQADAEEIEYAYNVAAVAQKKWENTPPMMKAQFYGKLAGLIMQHGDELAHLQAISMGK